MVLTMADGQLIVEKVSEIRSLRGNKIQREVSRVNIGMERLHHQNDDPTDVYHCRARESVITSKESKYQVVEYITNINETIPLLKDKIAVFDQVYKEQLCSTLY